MTHKLLIQAGGYLLLAQGGGDDLLLNETIPTPYAVGRTRRPSIVYKPPSGQGGSVVEDLGLHSGGTTLRLRGYSNTSLNVRPTSVARVRSVAMMRPAARGHLPETVE